MLRNRFLGPGTTAHLQTVLHFTVMFIEERAGGARERRLYLDSFTVAHGAKLASGSKSIRTLQ